MRPRLVHDADQLATVTRIVHHPAQSKPAAPPGPDPVRTLTLVGAVTVGPATATLLIAIAYQLAGGISPIALAVSSWVIWLIAMFTAAAMLETKGDS